MCVVIVVVAYPQAELVASLRHENIVRHLFHGWSGDRYCLGMPHYGTSLNNIIEQRLSQLSADESPAVNQAPNTQGTPPLGLSLSLSISLVPARLISRCGFEGVQMFNFTKYSLLSKTL